MLLPLFIQLLFKKQTNNFCATILNIYEKLMLFFSNQKVKKAKIKSLLP